MQTEGKYAAEVADRVAERLSLYARAWASTYRTIAESTLLRGEQSAVDMDRRIQCLERGRQQLEALADVLTRSDASIVHHAVDAAYRLPAPERCATSDLMAAPALPTSPELRARFLEVDRAVARVSALDNAGQDDQVEALVERTLPEARAISYRLAEAELLNVLGRAKTSLGHYQQSLSSYEESLFAAERAGSDALAARSASMIAFALSAYLERPQEAEGWIQLAQAIADRAGHDEAVEASVISSRIVVTAMLGHPEQVLDLHDREIALTQKLYGAADPRLARAIMNRAVTLNRIGRNDLSVIDAQRAIDLSAASSGPSNPHLDLSYITLGNPLGILGRLKEAQAAFERALELQAGRPPGTLTVCIYLNFAVVAELSGDFDECIRAATRGLEIANAIGDDQVFKWSLLTTRASALGRKGDLKAQAEGCQQALDAQRARNAVAADRLYEPDSLKCLGEVEMKRHRPEAAIVYFEQSVALERRPDPSELPVARFALARALRAAGRDPARARALAEGAREALNQIVSDHRDVAEIEEWLKEGEARVAVRTPASR
jgi:tetratricopeptide (TPR) repeat protein